MTLMSPLGFFHVAFPLFSVYDVPFCLTSVNVKAAFLHAAARVVVIAFTELFIIELKCVVIVM